MRHAASLMVLTALGTSLLIGSAVADTSGKKIAFSNNYAGNSWRQAMLKSWDKATKDAVSKGIVASAQAVHHRREPGDRAGGADPESDPARLRRHRHQCVFARLR